MPRRKPKPPPPRRRSFRAVLAVLITLGVAVGVLIGLGVVGDEARGRLGPRDRYRVPFADIECHSPPGSDRPTFLSEVRYVSGAPDTLQLLDPDLRSQLAAAFAAHPWVETVDGVDVEPPARVRVRLRFRSPVLAVNVGHGGVRLVDANGVLLPVGTMPPELCELAALVSPPAVPAGQVWADDTVRRAVELVKAYQPRRLEKNRGGWKLTGRDGTVLNVGG